MLNVALVGLGYWGSKLAHALARTPGVRISWLAEQDSELLALHRDDFPGTQLTRDVSDVVRDNDVQAVLIATPASTHKSLAAECIVGGKHVFVEKPLALSSGDSLELISLAAEHGRVLMVGHTFLFNEAVLQAKQVMESGRLGEIRYLNFTRTNLGPIRSDTSVVWDLASHDISMALWLVGRSPTTVSAAAKDWLNPGRADFATLWLDFAEGTIAQITVSWLSPERLRKFNIVGSKAMLSVDDANQATPLVLHSKYVEPTNRPHDLAPESAPDYTHHVDDGSVVLEFNWREPLVNQLSEFVVAAQSGVLSRSDGLFGLEVVSVLEAAEASIAKRGEPVAM